MDTTPPLPPADKKFRPMSEDDDEKKAHDSNKRQKR